MEMGSFYEDFDSGTDEIFLVNQSGLETAEVIQSLQENIPELARINKWIDSWSGSATRSGGVREQNKFVIPEGVFNQFKVAAEAVKVDDVVGNAVDTTEQLAFKTIKLECGEEEETNIANQILDNLDLEKRMREIWRELFTISQCYPAVIWERKDFKVKGNSPSGKKSKKVYKQVMVPKGITLLDPCKIIPVGNFMFGQERLAYIADIGEKAQLDKTLAGDNSSDLIVNQLFEGPYNPDMHERQEIAKITGDTTSSSRMFLLKEDAVWRITSSRPAYQRFADVRMLSVFPLLDMKHNLRASDRADILGNLNCIILVKKGNDDHPAEQPELAQVALQMKTSAKVPMIISDHRLEIEILTRKTDNVLRPERYNTLNSSIASRMYQTLNTGNYCVTPDTEILTRSGWKTHDQLVNGEEVYTLNIDTENGEWQEIKAVNVFNYEGEMLSMESYGHSSMSTPNHRWWVHGQIQKDYKKTHEGTWRTSESLKLFDRIPICAPMEAFPAEAKYTDELVELAAWFWMEGHRMVGSPNRISISQSQTHNPDYCDRIRLLLEKTFGPEGKVADGGVWYQKNNGQEFLVSAHVTEPLFDLFDLGPSGVTSPKRPNLDFLYSLTREQMVIFVDTCIKGDGHTEASGRSKLVQKDLKSVELFGLCLTMLGIPSRARLDKSKEESGVWVVELLERQTTSPLAAAREASAKNRNSASVEWVPYSGLVWCPTTANGTWFARRNGKEYFTGNSSGTGMDDSNKLFKVIASSMEARRDEIRDSIMTHIIKKIWEKNADKFKGEPEMVFNPRRVALEFNPQFTQMIYDLFIRGDISRETMLAELDISQEQEAAKRRIEDDLYEDDFEPRVDPGKDNIALTGDPKADGRAGGGNNNGGGGNGDAFLPNDTQPKEDPKDKKKKTDD